MASFFEAVLHEIGKAILPTSPGHTLQDKPEVTLEAVAGHDIAPKPHRRAALTEVELAKAKATLAAKFDRNWEDR